MSEELRARLYDLYAAYCAGAFDFVLNSFDDEADFISYAPVDVFPYLGHRHGKAAISDVMKKAHAEFEHVAYQPILLVVDKRDAAGIVVQARLRQRATNRMIHLLLEHFIRLRDGRIIELREFMDSFDAVQQVLGREIDATKL